MTNLGIRNRSDDMEDAKDTEPAKHEHDWHEGNYGQDEKGSYVVEHCACGETRKGRRMG